MPMITTGPRRAALAALAALTILGASTARAGYSQAAAGSLADPAATSAASVSSSSAVFLASSTDKIVKVRLGRPVADLSIGLVNLGLTFSGPVDPSGAPTRLASLDGLARAATAEAQVQLVGWDPATSRDEMKKVCQEVLQKPECTRLELPQEAQRRYDAAVDYGTPWLVSVAGEVGGQRFTWRDPTSLEAAKGTRTPWALKVGAGVVTDPIGFVGLSYRSEQSYEAGQSTQLCTPLGGGPSLRCDAAVLGGPTRARRDVGTVEARLFFGQFAVNPRAAYDFGEEVLGLELPVYFVKGVDQGLVGGVTLGWRSDERELTAVLFVGTTFELLPK